MDFTHFEAVITATSASLVGVAAVGALLYRSVVKPIRGIAETAQRVVEVVEGKEAVMRHGREIEARQPGVVERFDAQDKRLFTIETILSPDSGHSLADKVNVIAQVVTAQPGGSA